MQLNPVNVSLLPSPCLVDAFLALLVSANQMNVVPPLLKFLKDLLASTVFVKIKLVWLLEAVVLLALTVMNAWDRVNKTFALHFQ